MLDIVVFIDTPLDLCLSRRIQRDHTRGYDASDAIYRFKNHVFPSYMEHILYPLDLYLGKKKMFLINGAQEQKKVVADTIYHLQDKKPQRK